MAMAATQQRDLNRMKPTRYGKRVTLVVPTEDVLLRIMQRFAADVEDAAAAETVLSVFRHNPETMITFRNKTTGDTGCIAFLPLNSAGHIALAEGRFDTASPPLSFICKRSQQPISIYVWGINICARTAGGIAHAMSVIDTDRLRDVDLYCKAANERAYKLFVSMGFTDGAMINGRKHADLMSYKRRPVVNDAIDMVCPHEDRTRGPVYDDLGYRPPTETPSYATFDVHNTGENRIGIKLVHSVDELLKVMAIRAASYLSEQDMPYEEDADGNDLCAAHLIGYIGKEPAATVRLRFFADFCKIERLAVMPRFRGSSIGPRMVRAGIEYGRDKGYERFYGQAEKAAFSIWQRVGFVPRNGPGLSYMTERVYHEGDLVVARSPHAITPYAGADTIVRREGEWHLPGPFETERSV